jgi:hypothetical protein
MYTRKAARRLRGSSYCTMGRDLNQTAIEKQSTKCDNHRRKPAPNHDRGVDQADSHCKDHGQLKRQRDAQLLLFTQQLFTWRRLPGRPLCLGWPYSSRQWSRRNRRVRRRLALATGDSVLGLDLDWPARVAEVAPHFVAHSSTNFVWQGCQCLAGGSAAAFKRAVIHVE